MRARLALVMILGLVGTLILGLVISRPSAEPVAASPTPSTTASATATPAPTSSLSPSPVSRPPLPNVDLTLHATSVPSDFRFVATGSRLLVLDLTAGTATEVASFSVRQPEPGFPSAEVVASRDGASVLLTVHASQADGGVFLLTPQKGQARILARGGVARAALSPDGTRFAVARNDPDPALTGLWVGATSAASMRRVIADDPQSVGSPPVPYGFSPGGDLLAFGLVNGESGAHVAVVSFSSSEGAADRSSGTWAIQGSDAVLIGPSAGAEFITNDELFVWSSRSAFGGQTVGYTYKLAAKTTVELYRPAGDVVIAAAAWAPAIRGFASAERALCCGVALPVTVRTIAEDGSVRRLGEWNVIDMWWSRNGNAAKLYGILGLDDSAGSVVEMLTNKAVMEFCWRGGVPGSCT